MLRIELLPPDHVCESGSVPTLRARYINEGPAPLALTFWWNTTLRVRDASGAEVQPGSGPELPCGVGEDWLVLAPGERVERAEHLMCTQPAGVSAVVGWRYALPAGSWRVTLRHQAPPAHGFTQAPPHAAAFVGTAESNEVTLVVVERPGVIDRLKRLLKG
jgi:hypothetical protein